MRAVYSYRYKSVTLAYFGRLDILTVVSLNYIKNLAVLLVAVITDKQE